MQDFDKTFCVLPWLHSFVNIQGQIQVCCTSEEFDQGIRRPEGGVFNIMDGASAEEVMNSPYMRQVRLSLLQGKFPRLCTRCVKTEQMGGTSRRITENLKVGEVMDIRRLAEQTAPDGSIPVQVRHADYRLGNACNLQCRMCHPSSSVAWLKDWNEVKKPYEHTTEEDRQVFANIDWINSDVLMEDLRRKMPHLDFLHFAGGEPLFAPRMAEMLEVCVRSGRAHEMVLSYNTNITRLPPKVKALWKHFKEVRLLCSLDGFGAVNDYIRANSRWEAIDENLRTIDAEAADLRIKQVLFSTTVQAYNMLNLADLYEYAGTFQHTIKALSLVPLYRPDYLQCTILPESAKELARERLLAVKEKIRPSLAPHDLFLLDGIDECLCFMDSKDDVALRPLFWDFNARMDQRKGVSLARDIPELAQHMPMP